MKNLMLVCLFASLSFNFYQFTHSAVALSPEEEAAVDQFVNQAYWSAERTWTNSNEFEHGVERFVIHTAPSRSRLCLFAAEHLGFDECLKNFDDRTGRYKSPRRPRSIDYNKTNEICILNMPGNKRRCFDLYEIGER